MTRSSSSAWVALRVEVASELAEAVTNFLIEEGAPGVVTEEHDLTAPAPPDGRARLEAALPVAEHDRVARALERYVASLAEIHPATGRAVVQVVAVPAVDWTAIARQHHRPVATGRRILVVPPWEVPAASEREVLVIEPGMAFGTGQHATTRGCLEAIEAILAGGGIVSALDVGTGSGLLALALARLGVARVVGIDADAAVVPLARRNLIANGAAHVAVAVGTLRALRGTFDLVAANLLADAIVAEADLLAAAVAPGGWLVLSGILDHQAPDVVRAFPGWRTTAERSEEGWSTLTLGRGV